MSPQLPPPDPYESLGMSPEGENPLPGPAAVFVNGQPSAEVDRLSNALLELRPGALIVLAKD